MKKMILLSMFLTVTCMAFAQKNDSLNIKINMAKQKTGKQLIFTNDDYKLYASVKDGKVQSYSAVDTKGNDLVITYRELTTCLMCVTSNDRKVCWTIDCKNIPKPITTKRN